MSESRFAVMNPQSFKQYHSSVFKGTFSNRRPIFKIDITQGTPLGTQFGNDFDAYQDWFDIRITDNSGDHFNGSGNRQGFNSGVWDLLENYFFGNNIVFICDCQTTGAPSTNLSNCHCQVLVDYIEKTLLSEPPGQRTGGDAPPIPPSTTP